MSGTDEWLWREVLALAPGPRRAVLTHLGLGQPLEAEGERELARALVALGVEEDLQARSPQQTRTALVALLSGREAEIRDVLAPPKPKTVVQQHVPQAPPVGSSPAHPTSGAPPRRPRRLAVAAAVTAAVLGGGWALTSALAPDDPATLRSSTPAPPTSPEQAVPGTPVSDFTMVAGSWEPLDGGQGEVAGAAENPARLDLSPYGHWRGSDGCGGSVQGYFSLTSHGLVSATMQISGVPMRMDGCVRVPVDVAVHAEGRRLVLQGEQLVAVNRAGGVVARFERAGPPETGTRVQRAAQVLGTWQHTGVRGSLSTIGGGLPLRDVLTVEPAVDTARGEQGSSTASWVARSDACVAAGGRLVVDPGGQVVFTRTYRTEQSCSSQPGTLRWQLQEAVGLVLESPTTLLVVDDRGRETARLGKVVSGTAAAAAGGSE